MGIRFLLLGDTPTMFSSKERIISSTSPALVEAPRILTSDQLAEKNQMGLVRLVWSLCISVALSLWPASGETCRVFSCDCRRDAVHVAYVRELG